MALTPKRLFLYLCISISLLRPYTLFSRSPLVNKTLFENACELEWVVLYFKQPSCCKLQRAPQTNWLLCRLLQIFKGRSRSLRRLKRRSDSMAKASKVSPSVPPKKVFARCCTVKPVRIWNALFADIAVGPLSSEVGHSKWVSSNRHACAVTSTTNK